MTGVLEDTEIAGVSTAEEDEPQHIGLKDPARFNAVYKQVLRKQWSTYRPPEIDGLPCHIKQLPMLSLDCWFLIYRYLHPVELISLFFANLIYASSPPVNEWECLRHTRSSTAGVNIANPPIFTRRYILLYLMHIKNITFDLLPAVFWLEGTSSSLCPRITLINKYVNDFDGETTCLKSLRITREFENVTFLSMFCSNLKVLRLPQGFRANCCFLSNIIIRGFLTLSRDTLEVLDLSGYNLSSEHLSRIFTNNQDWLWGPNLNFLKFTGEQNGFASRTMTLHERLLLLNVEYITTALNTSGRTSLTFELANLYLRRNPIKFLRTLPDHPSRRYCSNEPDHQYCERCINRLYQATYCYNAYRYRLCECILRRYIENVRIHGYDEDNYCECMLTFIRWTIKCLFHFTMDDLSEIN